MPSRTPSTILLIATLLLFVWTGCKDVHAADLTGWYQVRSGDTLTNIARNFGVTAADIRRASSLDSDTLQPGQRLTVPKPFRRTSINDIRWHHPFRGGRGEILRTFGPYRQDNLVFQRTGVDLAYPPGSRVYAPANALVRYVGHQDGYGTIVILTHGAHFATLLGPFATDSALVEQERLVRRGTILGRTAEPVGGGRPYLHVELRRRTVAIDPTRLLQ